MLDAEGECRLRNLEEMWFLCSCRSKLNNRKEAVGAAQMATKKVELRVSKDNILKAGLLVLKIFQVNTIKQAQKVLLMLGPGQQHCSI
jgi:hypothetical protein